MSELRINPFNAEEVIIASKRKDRPNDYKQKNACPFCNGNEHLTTDATEVFYDENGNWLVKSVDNLYPIITESKTKCESTNLFIRKEEVGRHEVIIETNNHQATFYNFTADQFYLIFKMYQKRYKSMAASNDVKYISIIKNFGERAAASREHSHSQILSFSTVPPKIKKEMEITENYYQTYNQSIYDQFIAEEIDDDQRVINQSNHFITLATFAPHHHYQTEIICKTNVLFHEMNDDVLKEFSFVCFNLFKQYKMIGEIPFNMFLHTHVVNDPLNEYRVHLHIIPRLTNQGGVEHSTGIHVLGITPEEATLKLKF